MYIVTWSTATYCEKGLPILQKIVYPDGRVETCLVLYRIHTELQSTTKVYVSTDELVQFPFILATRESKI